MFLLVTLNAITSAPFSQMNLDRKQMTFLFELSTNFQSRLSAWFLDTLTQTLLECFILKMELTSKPLMSPLWHLQWHLWSVMEPERIPESGCIITRKTSLIWRIMTSFIWICSKLTWSNVWIGRSCILSPICIRCKIYRLQMCRKLIAKCGKIQRFLTGFTAWIRCCITIVSKTYLWPKWSFNGEFMGDTSGSTLLIHIKTSGSTLFIQIKAGISGLTIISDISYFNR